MTVRMNKANLVAYNILRKTIEGYQNSFDFITFGNIIFNKLYLSLIELSLCDSPK